MANRNHDWSNLGGGDGNALLECNSTGLDFWDIDRSKVVYCPACGEELS